MKWLLTENRLSGDKNWQRGNCKASDIPESNKMLFRLLDDDGDVYFAGLLDGKAFENAPGDAAFEPLDSFGAAYGCTELQYKQTGVWKTL